MSLNSDPTIDIPTPPPTPHHNDDPKWCALHGNANHLTEQCYKLKRLIENKRGASSKVIKHCIMHGPGTHHTKNCYALKRMWHCEGCHCKTYLRSIEIQPDSEIIPNNVKTGYRLTNISEL